MNTNIIGRPTARALAVVLLASSAAIGLSACQTAAAPAAPAAPAQVQPDAPRPFDRTLIEQYGGRPADRVAEEIHRAIQAGQLPSPDCISHHVVDHPEGGYHLVCVQARD
jgi:predicted RNase H-like nuclease